MDRTLLLFAIAFFSLMNPAQSWAETDVQFPALKMEPSQAKEIDTQHSSAVSPLLTTGSALFVVLAIFGVLVWAMRSYGPEDQSVGKLPDSVIQPLGTTNLDAKTRVTVLRFGDRILLVGQTSEGQPQTLAEITDPVEVARITNRCLGRPEIVGRRSSPQPKDLAVAGLAQ